MPGTSGEVLKKLGVTSVTLPGGEIFAALQSGAIDATEWVGPYNDLALGFYQVAGTTTGPASTSRDRRAAADGQRAGQALAHAELQEIVACGGSGDGDMLAEFNARSGPALRSLVKDHG